jgi:hypothetical protein
MSKHVSSNGSSPKLERISTTKAAQRLNVSPGTIRQFIADGLLCGCKIVDLRLLKVDAKEVDALVIMVDNS